MKVFDLLCVMIEAWFDRVLLYIPVFGLQETV